ncbi:hypothetical protein [Pseudonocardia sp. MH-G8]|uniref:hypothetical protein n=1 Tax=Pseudonocardia sp. MH-G8 TaxID=1854588 RepID=UPI00130407F7|nr:hypothetical protein [Pseudonocardia sp. MH-G8]
MIIVAVGVAAFAVGALAGYLLCRSVRIPRRSWAELRVHGDPLDRRRGRHRER